MQVRITRGHDCAGAGLWRPEEVHTLGGRRSGASSSLSSGAQSSIGMVCGSPSHAKRRKSRNRTCSAWRSTGAKSRARFSRKPVSLPQCDFLQLVRATGGIGSVHRARARTGAMVYDSRSDQLVRCTAKAVLARRRAALAESTGDDNPDCRQPGRTDAMGNGRGRREQRYRVRAVPSHGARGEARLASCSPRHCAEKAATAANAAGEALHGRAGPRDVVSRALSPMSRDRRHSRLHRLTIEDAEFIRRRFRASMRPACDTASNITRAGPQ